MIRLPKHRACRAALIATTLLLVTVPVQTTAYGQQAKSAAPNEVREERDPIEQRLIPPEVIMKNSQRIGLSAEQRQKIISIVKTLQPEMMGAELEHEAAKADLVFALDRHPIDEERAGEAANRALAAEDQVKKAHLTMLIRIRNQLSPDQQTRLKAIRGIR